MPTTLLILGGAQCVWDDIETAEKLCIYDAVMAVNDIGKDYPGRLDYWVTLHPDKLPLWASERCGSRDYEVWSHRRIGGVHEVLEPGKGGSGLFGIRVGLDQGFTKIVLAGVPMESTPHYFDDKPWDAMARFLPAWEEAEIGTYVRSMSGWTRETFGAPTKDWLKHSVCPPNSHTA